MSENMGRPGAEKSNPLMLKMSIFSYAEPNMQNEREM